VEAGGGLRWIDPNDPSALSRALVEAWDVRDSVPSAKLVDWTRAHYSTDAMSRSIAEALGAMTEDKTKGSRRGK
jgi:hypothetical protein